MKIFEQRNKTPGFVGLGLLVALQLSAQTALPPLPARSPNTNPVVATPITPTPKPFPLIRPVVPSVPQQAQAQGQALPPVPLAPPPPPALAPTAIPGVPTAIPGVEPLRTPATAIVWDAEFKEHTSKPGDSNAVIVFWLTNTHSAEVVINSVRPSCGCTVAKLPATPWHIAPGEAGPVEATLDLRGKFGTLTKSLSVDSSSGFKSLLFKVTIPDAHGAVSMADTDRLKNMQMSLADRQIVFKNADCAKCHAEPALGKMGQPLYQAACAICHDSPRRATMVPDLHALKHPTGPDHWRQWTASGRAGSLMPAFAKSEGGPLTDQQIDSLVNFLTRTIPSAPQPVAVPTRKAPEGETPSAKVISAPPSASISAFPVPKTP